MLRKARLKDIPHIHRLVNACAGKGEMLPRPLAELYDNMRDYVVYEDGETGEVQGACALHICWEDLAEIRSLCVMEHARRKGLGGEPRKDMHRRGGPARSKKALRAHISL